MGAKGSVISAAPTRMDKRKTDSPLTLAKGPGLANGGKEGRSPGPEPALQDAGYQERTTPPRRLCAYSPTTPRCPWRGSPPLRPLAATTIPDGPRGSALPTAPGTPRWAGFSAHPHLCSRDLVRCATRQGVFRPSGGPGVSPVLSGTRGTEAERRALQAWEWTRAGPRGAGRAG